MSKHHDQPAIHSPDRRTASDDRSSLESRLTPELTDSVDRSRTLTLRREDAAAILRSIHRWSSTCGSISPDLEMLRNVLEDGCWLARWKRETVVVELRSSILASVTEELLRVAQQDPLSDDAQMLEEMARMLMGGDC